MLDISALNDDGPTANGLFGRAWGAIASRNVDALDGCLALAPELALEGGSEGMGAHDIFARIAANHFQPLARSQAKRAKSLFHHACEKNSLDCANLLLREGARLNICCASGKRLTNPLLDLFFGVANAPESPKKEAKTAAFARTLINAGARFPHAENDAWNVAQCMASLGFFVLAQIALDAAAFNAQDSFSVNQATLSLSGAAASGNLAALRFFLSALPAREIFERAAQFNQDSTLARACSRSGGAPEQAPATVKCLEALLDAGELLEALPPPLSAELRTRSAFHACIGEWIDWKRAQSEARSLRAALPSPASENASDDMSRAARRRL